jgi:two-component SAPR family response regulator
MGILPFTATTTTGKSSATVLRPHVLIVEDNFLLSEHLVDVVQEDLAAQAMSVSCVSVALGIIPDDIVLAFLDIEVEDGKTYPAARKLMANNIPFIFVSGNEPSSLPDDLKGVPFLSKPVDTVRLIRLARELSDAFPL